MENSTILILLVDDDEGDRLIFEEAMEELKVKHTVQTVNDGMQLMEYLAKNRILPDLIFLDLNMPRKNGHECLKEIRSNKKFKDIAIAVYSTSSSEEDIEETFKNGANVYIKKPNSFSILKQLLCKTVTAYHLNREASFDREKFLLLI